jgi:hypothetical protein
VTATGGESLAAFFGECDFCNLPTRHGGHFAFLAIHKAELSVVEVNSLLTFAGYSFLRTDGQRDLICLAKEKKDGEQILTFLRAVQTDSLFNNQDDPRTRSN